MLECPCFYVFSTSSSGTWCVVLTQFALNGNDDKRIIMADRIRTMAYEHYRVGENRK